MDIYPITDVLEYNTILNNFGFLTKVISKNLKRFEVLEL